MPRPLLTLLALVVLLILCGTACFGQEEPSDRPRIGLCLAGGGARGGAHVGVLKVLEELRIPVDYIAGTSIGSIVGGLYASGYVAGRDGQRPVDVDWVTVFNDTPPRQHWSTSAARRKTGCRTSGSKGSA